ncbi:hypothetical protein FEM48_Zijuj09G0188000 [Ziziphus jujuba var. spinosa]|uniref:Uncharacterized protein n=1 Tax=Ziziphus jujuba var. spinosa TaxID=714518 RepID=A0A978UUP5_ZIZJJ|nr:hypothetical protein FEM48_Zijuj09G0188000 [Ziziphus jujuba var. spinosa]
MLRFLDISQNQFDANLTVLPSLNSIDLSHNQIRGNVPKWLWHVGSDSVYYLHLCNNFFTSGDQIPNKRLQILDFHFNTLRGHVPIPPPSIEIFLVSNNQLTGEVPISICNLKSFQALGLAHNSLNGNLLPCVGDLSGNLMILDMRMNKFDGRIPTTLFANNAH